MARLLDVAFDEDAVVAKGGGRLGRREREAARRLRVVVRDAHALAPAARRRLEHDRIAYLVGDGDGLLGGLHDREHARDRAHARGLSEQLGLDLVAHRTDCVRRRADKGGARGLDGLAESGSLGKEAVARVHRLGTRLLDRVDQPVDAQVRVCRGGRTNADGLVGHRHMRCTSVGLTVHADRTHA